MATSTRSRKPLAWDVIRDIGLTLPYTEEGLAWGTPVLLLVVMNFVYVNTIVFLVGVQLDELIEDGILQQYLPLPRSGRGRARNGAAPARRSR